MEGYIHQVQYYETDKMGIVHHSNYIRWMEEARVDMLSRIGWGYDRLEQLGIRSPVIGIDCKYKSPTTFPEKVEIRAEVREYKGVHLVVGYTMRRVEDGQIVLEGTSRHCFLNREGKFLRLAKEHPGLDAALRAMAEGEKE